jgi:hypothetical protein
MPSRSIMGRNSITQNGVIAHVQTENSALKHDDIAIIYKYFDEEDFEGSDCRHYHRTSVVLDKLPEKRGTCLNP